MGFIRISTLMLIFVSLHTFVIGEDKHMICKTVDDLFTVDGGGRSHHSPITTRRLQGPPGKLGPPGIKGDVGPPGPRGGKGSPGADNNGRIDQVEVRLTARIEEIERRFQEKISHLNDTVAEIQSVKERVKEKLCDGVFYQGLCYFSIIHASEDMNYNEAVENCRAKSSKPADILDSAHYNMIFEYVRSLASSSNRYLWLGMTFNSFTKVVSLSNGNRASYVKYRSNYPYSSSTQMGIKVDQDMSSTSQGMFKPIQFGQSHVCSEWSFMSEVKYMIKNIQSSHR